MTRNQKYILFVFRRQASVGRSEGQSPALLTLELSILDSRRRRADIFGIQGDRVAQVTRTNVPLVAMNANTARIYSSLYSYTAVGLISKLYYNSSAWLMTDLFTDPVETLKQAGQSIEHFFDTIGDFFNDLF